MFGGGASVSSFLVRMVIDAARRRGLSERAFRRSLGFSTSVFESSPRVPLGVARQVWMQTPVLVEEPELGVLAAEEGGPGAFGFFSTLAECSATWGEAMERLVFCVSMANRAASLELVHGPSTVSVVLNAPNGVRTGLDLLSTSICLQTRARMGDAGQVLAVRYAFERPHKTSEYERVFGVAVEFGAPRTELVYGQSLYAASVPGARTELGALLESFVRRSAKAWSEIMRPHSAASDKRRTPSSSSFLAEARLALQVCIEQGTVRLSDVASVMGISPRSLQRHLRESQSSLRDLVSQQRTELAVRCQGMRSKAATARLLGYSDRRTLGRAQARWHEYRGKSIA